MCCRTMPIADLAEGYMLSCIIPGRQYGTDENVDRNRSPGDLSAPPFHSFTREFNLARVCFNIMH